MTQALKLEESFFKIAVEEAVILRLTLANRERLTGIVKAAGKYDLNLESEGRIIALMKKEVFQVLPSRNLIDESFFQPRAEEEPLPHKSRVQDEFLDRYVKERTLALLRLGNGEEIRGVIEGYDGFTISIRTGRGQTLIYKHGLCNISPGYRRRQRENEHQPI
jgi:RNA chaperone Hfq